MQFGTSSADLLDSSTVLLDEIVTLLQESPDVQIAIRGHTDADGDPEQNQLLSEERAAAVVQYLIDRGIAGERLSAVGFGDTQPVASNDTKEGKAENRRIEFIIIPG